MKNVHPTIAAVLAPFVAAAKRPALRVCCLCNGPASEADASTCADAFCGARTILASGEKIN